MARTRRDVGSVQRVWGAERGEAGFTIIELVVGITLMAIVSVGFAASIAAGFRTVLLARQRTTASEVASARLEHLRSVPYDDIRMDELPTGSTDSENPDFWVDADDYDVTGNGDDEEMVVAGAGEAWGVLHIEDPVVIGDTVVDVYQYATWVDDPAISGDEDYKRVTVVVTYKAPAVNGVNRIVRVSTLFTPDTITYPNPGASTTTVATTTTTTTTAPSSTTTAPASCPGDITGPTGSFSVLGGSGAQAGFTASPSVTLSMTLADTCTPIVARFSNEGGPSSSDVPYDPLDPELSWALSTGDGLKSIGGEATDGVGNSTTLAPVTITLDQTPPTTPSAFGASLSCAGTDRTVVLSWGLSIDTNFAAYRVYKNSGSGFAELGTTSGLSFTDAGPKSATTQQYYVVGYDKAGNESDATSTISLSKSQCS